MTKMDLKPDLNSSSDLNNIVLTFRGNLAFTHL